MKKQIIRPLLTCAAALVFTGCSTAHHPSDAEISAQVLGSWTCVGGSRLIYSPDGSWLNQCMSDGKPLYFSGTWQVKDSVLTRTVTNAPVIGGRSVVGGMSLDKIIRIETNQIIYKNKVNGKTEALSR
jgi:hypothetical protein